MKKKKWSGANQSLIGEDVVLFVVCLECTEQGGPWCWTTVGHVKKVFESKFEVFFHQITSCWNLISRRCLLI